MPQQTLLTLRVKYFTMKVLCIFLSMTVAINAYFHEVGTHQAARTKRSQGNISDVHVRRARAAGGEEAAEGAHPYLVGLLIRLKQSKERRMCGASLVNTHSLVTAAHCVDRATMVKAVLGSLHILHKGLRLRTKEFIIHPLYSSESYKGDYDVAIVRLPQSVEFSDTIQPINLPSSPDEYENVGEWAMAAGWGITSDDPDKASENPTVMQVRLQIIPELVCKKRLLGRSRVFGNNVCTNGAGGVGVCKGDGGGPLYVERNGKKILVGVASFGHVFCEKEWPSAFLRVATYMDFLKLHL